MSLSRKLLNFSTSAQRWHRLSGIRFFAPTTTIFFSSFPMSIFLLHNIKHTGTGPCKNAPPQPSRDCTHFLVFLNHYVRTPRDLAPRRSLQLDRLWGSPPCGPSITISSRNFPLATIILPPSHRIPFARVREHSLTSPRTR